MVSGIKMTRIISYNHPNYKQQPLAGYACSADQADKVPAQSHFSTQKR
jgi:hypothetical protein